MGGIGKTTISKAIYDSLYHRIEGSSFLANVREDSEKRGLYYLQKRMLSDIFKEEMNKQQISGDDNGVIVIKRRLKHTKDEIYRLQEMSNEESLQLFSLHAFKEYRPKQDYMELSKNIVEYARGLPLALVVLGSFLCGREIPERKCALKELREIPNDKLQSKLRISYDALSKQHYKDIFLDVACFFIGMDKDFVNMILKGCGFHPEIGIAVLTERCLISVNKENKLMMHDLLRDMGRQIVHEESLKDPGERSRSWSHQDAHDILKKNMLDGVNLEGDYGHLLEELRWLCWRQFPLESIPANFDLEKPVVLDMRRSYIINQPWKETKSLVVEIDEAPVRLKKFTIGCSNMTSIPTELTGNNRLLWSMRIFGVDDGVSVIKMRLHYKRVLVVLHDVDYLNQINALAGDTNCKNKIYKVQEMNNEQSLQLFSLHAFKEDHPREEYIEISNNIVEYARGIPLALV
ncbi:PREDICTED: TMV resistance protein N-like [Nelumbo nucifera]|uniref:TMV resistance protein N-like n=1 Tax=Nelumbo nucifera TaxID=4432 RepID=A0A1U8AD68_NELNU|nr:PREDICTED: TMV resistance protein N-like [Nelumbo nucifera]